MNYTRLMRTIERYEGFRQFPYKCTAGKTTIGIGRNLDDKGITYAEAKMLLKHDLANCQWDLENIFPKFNSYPGPVQEVLMNMRFQLGYGGFRSFKRMIAAVIQEDYIKAASEMRNSKWYEQTTKRAEDLSTIMEKQGEHYETRRF